MDDKLRNACRIFNILYQQHELNAEVNQDLYQLYKDDFEIQDLVAVFAEEADVSILRSSGSLYLIPNQQNTFLGFKNQDYKDIALKSYNGVLNDDVGLAHFIELVMMNALFSSEANYYEKSLALTDLQNLVLEELTTAKEQEASRGDDKKIYARFYELFSSYAGEKMQDGTGPAEKHTRKGLIKGIVNFYVAQGLLEYASENQEYIRATDRFDTIFKKKALLKRYREVTLENLAGGELDE